MICMLSLSIHFSTAELVNVLLKPSINQVIQVYCALKGQVYGKAQGVVFTVGKDAPGIYLKEIE